MEPKTIANFLVIYIMHSGKTAEELVEKTQFLLEEAYKKGYEDGKRDLVSAFRDEIKKGQPQ